MDPDDQSLETSSSFSPTEVTFTTVSPVHYEAPPRLNIVEQIVVPVLYCIISFIGLIGNGIVLYIMRHMVKNKSVTDVYVTNLAVADILLLGTLPFWAAEHVMGRWVFGTIMCKIASCMTYMNMYASIFFLAIMSLDRWLAIVKAIKCRTLRTVQKAWIISSLIWGLSLFFMILPSLFRTTKQYRHGDRCVWEFPKGMTYHLNVLYNVLRSIVGFFLPLIVIVFCYSDLVRFMRKRSSKSNNKVTQMVLVVVSCFIISWLPNQTLLIIRTYSKNIVLNHTPNCHLYPYSTIMYIHLFTACLGFSNSMMNPVVYSFMGAMFRKKL
uniref:G-protein coupled receptors family 1 profile domain-containing protein n=1 Tax=Ciona intestinalis TaxID=7719 RepID=H2XLB2_CIOIN